MAVIEQLALLSARLFWQVVNLSITGSIAILVILIIRLPLQQVPKRFSYALWSVAAFRLLCPVSFSSVFSLFNLNLFRQASLLGNRQDSLDYVPADTVLVPVRRFVREGFSAGPIPVANGALPASLPGSLPGADTAADVAADAAAGVATSLNLSQIIVSVAVMLWLAGVVVMLLYGVISYVRTRQRVSGSVRLEGNIYGTDRIPAPCVLGFFRPKIYLPHRLSGQEKAYILAHERFHIRHGDHLLKPLACGILAIHWFNPLVWLAFSSMLRDMEMRCDEAVLSRSGLAIKCDYSTSLLALAVRTRLPVASPLAFGESNVKARVKNVLNFHKPKTWIVLVTLLFCLIAILAISANPAVRQGDLIANDDSALNEAVHRAVLARIEKVDYYTHDFAAEAHTILKAVASGNRVTTYAVVLEQRYTFNDQGVAHYSGSHGPRALTFEKAGDKSYRLLEYWTPEWGDDYGSSISKKFPADIAQTAKTTHLFTDEHVKACNMQALAYYETTYSPLHILTGNLEHVTEFLQLAKDIGYDQLPRMYPDDTCYNVTPDYIYAETGCRIFKYSESCESFLLADGQIYPLGTGFGGFGLTDLQLCDFDRNGQADLLYTYSWGSGIHRSEIGLFNLTTKEEARLVDLTTMEDSNLEFSDLMNELYLVKLAEDHFVVYTADRVGSQADRNLGFAQISLVRNERLAEITDDNGEISIKSLD
ncbi:MAG: M56 family metallopeptidase [Bacillota bacterium]|nr:M56 family metallopeptidase [Bacillota bacterium]